MEFVCNQTILTECVKLADFYGTEDKEDSPLIEKEAKEEVSETKLGSPKVKVVIEEKNTKASDKAALLCDILMDYRKNRKEKSAQECPLPDFKDPKVEVFQKYILQSGGPTLIEELAAAKQHTLPAPKKKKKRTKKKKKKQRKR